MHSWRIVLVGNISTADIPLKASTLKTGKEVTWMNVKWKRQFFNLKAINYFRFYQLFNKLEKQMFAQVALLGNRPIPRENICMVHTQAFVEKICINRDD